MHCAKSKRKVEQYLAWNFKAFQELQVRDSLCAAFLNSLTQSHKGAEIATLRSLQNACDPLDILTVELLTDATEVHGAAAPEFNLFEGP
jgi:hypothetical protein